MGQISKSMGSRSPIITSKLLAANVLLNGAGYVIPLLIFLFATPLILNQLGPQRYGILTLVWTFTGYGAIFDFGMGPATTRYVAAALGRQAHNEIPPLIATTAGFQLAVGSVVGVAMAASAPYLTEHVFSIPASLFGEAQRALAMAGAFLPLVLVSGSLTGVCTAFQRFDLVNLVRIGNSTLVAGSCLLGIYFHTGIDRIVVMILGGQILLFLAQVFMVRCLVPDLFLHAKITLVQLKSIAAFSGWMTVSSMVNPLMMYLDRSLIAIRLSVAALAYYSVALDLSNRLLVISTSLTSVLFPTFATISGQDSRARARRLTGLSMRALLLVSGPFVCALSLTSYSLLYRWGGQQIATHAFLPLQILLLSMLFDYPGIITSTLLEGIGRPKPLALTKCVYLPVHAVLLYTLLPRLGIMGAAVMVLLMRLVYSASFTGSAVSLLDSSFAYKKLIRGYALILAVMVGTFFLADHTTRESLGTITLHCGGLVTLCFGAEWFFALTANERRILLSSLLRRDREARIDG